MRIVQALLYIVHFENTSITPERYPRPSCIQFLSLPQPLANSHLLFVSPGLPFLYISYKWNHTIHGLLCMISSLSIRFSRFIHTVVCVSVPFLSWLNDVSLYGHSTFGLPTHHLMGIWWWTFWLLWMMLLWIFMYKFFGGHLISLGWIHKSGIAGLYGKFMLNFLKRLSTFF